MKHTIFAVCFAITALAACNGSVSLSSGSASSSSSSSSGPDSSQVSLSGTVGHAELAGDRIDLKDGVVRVNDISFGPSAPDANVQYTVTPTSRELKVDGKLRTAVH